MLLERLWLLELSDVDLELLSATDLLFEETTDLLSDFDSLFELMESDLLSDRLSESESELLDEIKASDELVLLDKLLAESDVDLLKLLSAELCRLEELLFCELNELFESDVPSELELLSCESLEDDADDTALSDELFKLEELLAKLDLLLESLLFCELNELFESED